MKRSPPSTSSLLCALAFVVGAESVAAKCRNPLRVGMGVPTAVVLDGMLRDVPSGQLDPLLQEIGPDDVHTVRITCWRPPGGVSVRELSVILVLTKQYVASLGDDVTADEAVEAALAEADPDIRELWDELTAGAASG